MRRVLATAALGLLFFCTLGFTTPEASTRAVEEEPATALLLARAYVGEAGWHSRRDHQAIFWALRNRAEARGIPFRRQLDAYAKGAHGRWVADLRPDGTLGSLWPEIYPRARFEPLWRRVLVYAATDLVFEPENPCQGPVEHWAGRIQVDARRAHRAVSEGRWRPLDCGPTRQGYFAVRR